VPGLSEKHEIDGGERTGRLVVSLVSSGHVPVSDTIEEVHRFEVYGFVSERVATTG
jgi:hypothetical protein